MTHETYEKILKQVLRVYKMKGVSIPNRVVDNSDTRIIKILEQGYRAIGQHILNNLQYNGLDVNSITAMTELQLLNQIEQQLNLIQSQIQEVVTDKIETEYIRGQLNHYISTTGILNYNEVLNNFPFATINWYTSSQLISDAMEDILVATSNTNKGIKKVVKSTVAKHLQLNALQGESYKTIKNMIIKDLQKKGLSEKIVREGFVGIIDKGGKKWGLKNYVDMVVQTKTHQAYIEGIKQQAIETGKDLAVIPVKGATDPCKHFEGMVISLTGLTEGYMSYEQLKATNLIFHPRCKHNPIPINSMEALHPEDQERHKQQLASLKKLKK